MFKKNISLLSLLILSSCTKKMSEDFIKDLKFIENEITVTSFSEDKKAHNLQNTIALRNDSNSVLRIHSQIVENAEALKIIDQKSNEIKMMFAPQQVPYMGQITKDISCTDAVEVNNKPSVNEKEISLLMNLTATERLIYGSCIPDQEIYKSQLLMLYCKNSKTLYEIKYFYDKQSEYKKQIAHCL